MRRAIPNAPAGEPRAGEARSLFIESGGRRRRLVLYTPASAPAGAELPLVVDLHGSTSYPEEELALSSMTAAAEEHRFAVLAPEGIDRSWNVPTDATGPDDVRFIDAAIDRVQALLAIDATRIYATGFSAGGRMASTLAGGLDGRLAAIAPVAGLRFDRAHAPARPVPVLTFHGMADPVNPFGGGGPPYWQTGVEEAVAAWAAHNGCAGRRDERVSSTVTRSTRGSDPNAVVLYRIAGMGHQWPGSPLDIGREFGPPAASPAATELIAAFFAAQRLAPDDDAPKS